MSRRSALVTGGSAGIGLAIASMLIKDGWAVTIVGRDRDKLDDALERLSSDAGAVSGVAANLADDVAATVVAQHLACYDNLDLLVNNAGISLVGPLESKTPKALDLEISLNLRTAVRLLQESLPALYRASRARGASHVVNISSMTAKETPPFASVYSATKAALVAFSRSAHAELSPDGIHVTALLPGFVDTPGTSWAPPANQPSMMQPNDIAEAIRFLLRTSARCFVPEIQLTNVGSGLHELVDWKSLA